MKEAMCCEQLEDSQVRCNLCTHRCIIVGGHMGICQVRENRHGTIYTLVYERA